MKISNYKAVKKGCLLGRFDVCIEDLGMTIRDCSLFQKGESKWVGLPSRQFQTGDGQKKFFDYVVFDKEKKAQFDLACIASLGAQYPTACVNDEGVPF